MEGHLHAHWLAQRIWMTNVSTLPFGAFPYCGCIWSPWWRGELCKPLCSSGFILTVYRCWMENFGRYGRYIPDLNLLVSKKACTLPAQIQCNSDASCSHLVPSHYSVCNLFIVTWNLTGIQHFTFLFCCCCLLTMENFYHHNSLDLRRVTFCTDQL